MGAGLKGHHTALPRRTSVRVTPRDFEKYYFLTQVWGPVELAKHDRTSIYVLFCSKHVPVTDSQYAEKQPLSPPKRGRAVSQNRSRHESVVRAHRASSGGQRLWGQGHAAPPGQWSRGKEPPCEEHWAPLRLTADLETLGDTGAARSPGTVVTSHHIPTR